MLNNLFKSNNYGKIYQSYRRFIYHYKCITGLFCEHQLDLVYAFCGREPVSIRIYRLVPHGENPEENGPVTASILYRLTKEGNPPFFVLNKFVLLRCDYEKP